MFKQRFKYLSFIFLLISLLFVFISLAACQTIDKTELHQSSDSFMEKEQESHNTLPLYYSAYSVEPSQESAKIYNQLSQQLPETVQKQCKREPAFIEFAVRFYSDYDYSRPSDEIADSGNKFSQAKIPYFVQWDQRWGFTPYAASTIAESGCGPTCLAMIYTAIKGEAMYPDQMSAFAENNNFAVDGEGTSWLLFSRGAEKLGLEVSMPNLDYDLMLNALKSSQPLIVHLKAGKFTSSGHFIVIRGVEEGKFQIYDPFSYSNSLKLWTYDELACDISAIWAYSGS